MPPYMHLVPTQLAADTPLDILTEQLGANLLTQTPEIAQWLAQKPETLDLAAIAYLDGEKHVRVAMAMDAIMQYVSEHKADSSLMFMCTPTDVYAVPEEVISASAEKFQQRSQGAKATHQKYLQPFHAVISSKRICTI